MEKKFTMEYWKDEGWYVGRLKEIPEEGCVLKRHGGRHDIYVTPCSPGRSVAFIVRIERMK